MELKKEWFEPGLDGGSSLDERTGLTDRRTGWSPLYVRQFSRYGLPDRRRTGGTITDRKETNNDH